MTDQRAAYEAPDDQTCDRCSAFAPWSAQDIDGDQRITRWFACNRHLAVVLREGRWEVDAVEVRYLDPLTSRGDL